ncbi:MAG: phosphopantothenoylcysteine decarboxylase [Candidatus Altiarchaeota archaeon]
MRVLITAGPTREYIDDVRYITNSSSGIMGLELAQEAVRRGHEVTLVLGPTSLQPMYGVRVIPAVSADEMTDKVLKELAGGYDLMISAAAIGDFTPSERFKGKLGSAQEVTVRLRPTRKLIREARERFPELRIVAFKATYDSPVDEMVAAARKLMPYADLVIANDVSRDVFGSENTEVHIVCDEVKCVPRTSKRQAAKAIMDSVESMLSGEGGKA